MNSNLGSFRIKFEKELKTGLLSFLVLAAIDSDKGPSYGYRIIRKLEDSSKGRYSLPEGTVYPVLNSLSKRGFLKTYWGDPVSGPRRKYYEITPEGKKALGICLNEWSFITSLVDDILRNMGVEK
ncbi:MAG: PadR family transcriptional regulator [Thermoplasmatota archaeon]